MFHDFSFSINNRKKPANANNYVLVKTKKVLGSELDKKKKNNGDNPQPHQMSAALPYKK